ncbi:MAG: adenine-specific DNA methylase [Phycisphaerae bacterium]|jgi:putative DNA methylase|nr:adenine-specific DNA methylase [Phycisphaerae bacterium]MBM91601.1 adenine-specific DNA methylase [Phycisphaerae bacterium]
MTPYPKRIIEVDLPIARISAHARSEKDSRVAHIPRLHIYPAARPLAACRAVILASLWPDPVDLTAWQNEAGGDSDIRAPRNECHKTGQGVVIRPERFLGKARSLMAKWANYHFGKASAESYENLIKIQKDATLLDEPEFLRTVLLDFIADYSKWNCSIDSDFIDLARNLTSAAHECLGGEENSRPIIIDPFAGGGAFPVEASRCGCESIATDLNPLSILLNELLLVHLPIHGTALIEAVDNWAAWMKPEAQKRLAELYPPQVDGAIPVAYLWSRVIISDAPGGDSPVEVPMLKTMWLAKQRNRQRALRWVRNSNGIIQTDEVKCRFGDGRILTVRRPRLEIFTPTKQSDVEVGTARRGSVTCPVTGYTTQATAVREQLKARNGGAHDARLHCVVVDGPNGKSRDFRLPSDVDYKGLKIARERHKVLLSERMPQGLPKIPDEATPPGGGRGAGRAFSQRKYGMDTFADLFNQRQLIAMSVYVDLCREYIQMMREHHDDMADALETLLSLLVDRLADLNAALCVWQLNTPNTAHVFGRWVLQIAWDFGEVNPLAAAGGSPESAIRRMKACLSDYTKAELIPGHALQTSAEQHPWPDNAAHALLTDPPYYDAVPYSDLMDFFYVWLKRTITGSNRTLFASDVGPKDQECIVDEVKGKDDKYFEITMAACLRESKRVVRDDGIGVIVFAHKSTLGWERMLASVIDAGWAVTGSWPIDTEMGSRLRAKDSAALASSVHLICRPREMLTTQGIRECGEWRDILSELPSVISAWMPRLATEGIVGADAVFACLGPALELFSRYERVERASGELVSLREYLEQVWAAVSSEALSMIFKDADAAGLEPDARLTAMWLWTIGGGKAQDGADEAEEVSDEENRESSKASSTGFTLEFDAARKIAQGLGVHLEKSAGIVEVKGDKARLLPVAERLLHLFGKEATEESSGRGRRKKKTEQKSLFEQLEAIEAEIESGGSGRFGGLDAAKPGATVLDKVHQAMVFFASGRGEALRRFLVDDGIGKDTRFWKLAQALSALYPASTDEKRWVDGVLARKKGLGL